MKVLECTISEELKMVLESRGIRDTEDLLDPLYADDLADIKKNESSEVSKELSEVVQELEAFMIPVKSDNSTQFEDLK